MAGSRYLSGLSAEARSELESRLLARQSGHCFICDDEINLVLHRGQLDIDHIDPLQADGLDAENNFALTHATCNRSKQALDLRVARRLAEFDRLQRAAVNEGRRGATLADVLARHGGSRHDLAFQRRDGSVEWSLPAVGRNAIQRAPVYHDKLSGTNYFFALLPIEYVHHDDRINPRSIGNIRGLIEEFHKGRPQLHVGLAWWAPTASDTGPVKIFDGQHKAAAQILLGTKEIPVRIFLEPDIEVLITANTNAGSTLRQVAFDAAVMRHLGSTLYLDRVRQYQQMRGLDESDYSFSELDLVRFFKGERKEMERYIVDAHRDAITHNKENELVEFVEWSGKGSTRPLAYSTIERSFYRHFLFKKALDSPIGEGAEVGTNPRLLERQQMLRLMKIFAEAFLVEQWDPDVGGQRLENRVRKGEAIPEAHLRAWRVCREEIIANIIRWAHLVVEHYYAYAAIMIDKDRLLHQSLPEALWKNLENFIRNLAKLPCWIDPQLANTVFGSKQNLEYWETIFKTGQTPSGIRVLARGLDLPEMIRANGGAA